MAVPEGYDHKATSEGFGGRTKVSIYHSRLDDDFYIEIGGPQTTTPHLIVTRTELQLIVHAGKDVLDDESV
jgi:hypothetical protein